VTNPSPTDRTIIIPPRDASKYLAKRNIDAGCFVEALQEGLAQRQNCTAYHPITAPGYYQWSETNRAIREFHCGTGKWKMANPDNRPLLVHADNTTKFVAAAGNSATGIRGAYPNVARKKGGGHQPISKRDQPTPDWARTVLACIASFRCGSHTPTRRMAAAVFL